MTPPNTNDITIPATVMSRKSVLRWVTTRGPLSPSFWSRMLTFSWCSITYIFLLSPMIVVIGASFHSGEYSTAVRFPPQNPSLDWYFKIPSAQIDALGFSFVIATISAAFAITIGIPAALGIVRSNLKLKDVISSLFRAPLQIPAIVSGIAFLQMFFVFGDLTGIYGQGTLVGLVIGHTFLAIPFVVGSVVAVLQRFDNRLEEAALILGANRWNTFRRVTLPVIMPGVYAGGLYGFIVSFGDVPLSIFLTAPGYVTYPVEIFFALENDFDPGMLASGSLVIYICLILLLVVQRGVGLDRLLKSGGGAGR
jgi:putative spermidine/putrescine transport system permease protein